MPLLRRGHDLRPAIGHSIHNPKRKIPLRIPTPPPTRRLLILRLVKPIRHFIRDELPQLNAEHHPISIHIRRPLKGLHESPPE